jgi:hypothetical protein
MPYTKPEINTLGDASSVIQNQTKWPPSTFDPLTGTFCLAPAYDFDE